MPVARKRLRNDEESVDMVADIVTKHAVANKLAAEQVPALVRTVRSALAELTDGHVASGRKKSPEKPAASPGERERVSYRQLVEGMEAGYQVGSDAMPTEEDCAKVRLVVENLSKEQFPQANIVRVKVRGGASYIDGAPIYFIRIVYDSPFDSIPVDRSLDFNCVLSSKLKELGLMGLPNVSYVLKEEEDQPR